MSRKRRRAKSKGQQPRALVPLDVAMDIAEDLPDGAYFALIEELSGCGAADVADFIFDDEEAPGG